MFNLLICAWTGLNENENLHLTKYTVSIPKGTVKRSGYTVENEDLKWSFTTLRELPPPCVFTDVPEHHWAANIIKELCQKGIIGGYPGGIFKPGNDITRAEFTKKLLRRLVWLRKSLLPQPSKM